MADLPAGPSGGALGNDENRQRNRGGRPKGSRPDEKYLKPHGTRAAHRRHSARNEPLCGDCVAWEATQVDRQAQAAQLRAQGNVAIRDEQRFADPVWRAEFRGFFAGDGWLGVTKGNHLKGGSSLFYAVAVIVLRDDDRAVLDAIAEVIGGSVWNEDRGGRNPTAVWRTRTPATIGRICNALEDGMLPFAKARQVPLMREFLSLVGIPGDEARAQRERVHEALRIAHTYGGATEPIGVQIPAVELCECTHRRSRHSHPRRAAPYGCAVCLCTRYRRAPETEETPMPERERLVTCHG